MQAVLKLHEKQFFRNLWIVMRMLTVPYCMTVYPKTRLV